MDEYRGTITGSSSDELFSKMPPDVKSVFVEGFSELRTLSPEQTDKLVSFISDTYYAQVAPDFEALGDVLGVPQKMAQALGTSTALAIGVSIGAEDVEKFTETAARHGVLNDEASKDAFKALVAQLERKSGPLKEQFRSASLAARVLPSFESLQATIDVRLRFEKGAISGSVPVVVAHLDTDIDGQHIWFQIDKAHLTRLETQIKKLLGQIEDAEKWSSRQ